MASAIGKAKGGNSGKSFEVRWDGPGQAVYVVYGVATAIGRASTAAEAMTKAEAWLYNK